MRHRSKSVQSDSDVSHLPGEFTPVRLPVDFPISKPHHVTRSSANAIRAHIHECFEIGYCHDGSGVFLIGGKMLHCGPGDAVAIREGDMHVLVSPQDSFTRWSFVNLDPLGLLAGSLRDLSEIDSSPISSYRFMNVIPAAVHPDICSLVRDIVDELDRDHAVDRQALRAMVWTLVVKLRRIAAPMQAEEPESVRIGSRSFEDLERLGPAVRQIADDFSESLSVNRLAKLCHMSEPNFRRLFHRRLGASPREYIHRLRIEVAKSLLRNSSLPVLDLSLKAGFPSLSNFNRQFKRSVGMTPREFRHSKT